MNKISEIRNEKQKVDIHFEDGTRVVIPEREIVRIKDRGTSKISIVREMLESVVVPSNAGQI